MLFDCAGNIEQCMIGKFFPSSLQFDILVVLKSLFPQDINDYVFKVIQRIFSL